MKPKIDAPSLVRQGEELDVQKLNDYVGSQVLDFGNIVEVQQFSGGYSNLTYFLKTDTQREYVLRRPPFGAKHIKGGHDMAREFRVLSSLKAAGYAKIPNPIVFCEDESVLDCPFYVMERVQGVVLRAQTAPQMNLDTATMRRLSEALIDNLVVLHGIDIYQTNLIQLGKPEGYIRRQVEGWQRRYVNAQTDDIAAMQQTYEWLMSKMPAAGPPTLIHNDYKYDNVILNAHDLSEIVAVLDWEMCTVGDPLMDLGTSLSYWAEATDGAFEKTFNFTWLPGNLSRAEVAQRYAQKSGRDVSNLLYFYVFGLFKNAVVVQQIYARWKNGFSKDERFAGLLFGVKSLSSAALKAIERGTL